MPVVPASVAGLRDGAALARRLGELAQGLCFDHFGSESGSMPLAPFHAPGPFAGVSRESALEALARAAVEPRAPLRQFEPAEAWLKALVRAYADDDELAPRARALAEAVRAALAQPHALVVGEDVPSAEFPAFVLGLAPDGSLAGLRSAVVWT